MRALIKIKGYRKADIGTELKIYVDKDIEYLFKENGANRGEIRIDDGRTITSEQRKKAYATIKDIADFLGYMPEEAKELLKYEHIARKGSQYISLSNCTVEEAREFINSLIEFALDFGIPLSEAALQRTDDLDRYLWYCLKTRKCSICGKKGEVHHWKAVGMGNDRKKIDDSNYPKICLCRSHHMICHNRGNEAFSKMYHCYGIIYNDKK